MIYVEYNKNNNSNREFPIDKTSNEDIKESNENNLCNTLVNTDLTNFDKF